MSRRRRSVNDPTSRLVLGSEGTSKLRAILDTFNEEEARVISMRFGLADGRPKDEFEIARALKMAYRSVREIEHRAITRLQISTNSSTLMYKDGKEVVGLLDARLSAAELSIDADPEVVHCPQCQRLFWNPPTGARRREYCSNKCRQAAYRARQRAKAQ